ncbi:MAG TPA: sulfotransferase domain-containing protein [Lacipirellula sp.]
MLQSGLHSRNGLVRKGCALALQAPKKLAQAQSRGADLERLPPVFANSFPKSGTHLLDQIVAALPERRNYGTFLSSQTSSFQFRRRSDAEIRRIIAGFVPGEIVRAHLWYSPAAAESLAERRAVHYLIIRDPRDVVVSEAHYLRSINRWHKLHPYFRAAASIEDAISLSIRGLGSTDARREYPHIAQRFAQYEPWLNHPEVCVVRFETLMGPQRDETLLRMIRFYGDRAKAAIDLDRLLPRLTESIAPSRSHTFRAGKAGGWRQSFTDVHRELFKELAGQTLIRLGYESDSNW